MLLLAGGLVAWGAGYRLFRFVLTIFGFYFGAAIASSMFGTSDTTVLIMAAIGGGALGAVIMFFGYFVGVALVGAVVGALVIHLAWSRVGSDPHPFIVVLASVAGAASAMALQRYVITVVTAFAGAWSLLIGTFLSIDRHGPNPEANAYILYPFDLLRRPRWVQVSWAVLGLAGLLVQMQFSGRGKSKPRVRKES